MTKDENKHEYSGKQSISDFTVWQKSLLRDNLIHEVIGNNEDQNDD